MAEINSVNHVNKDSKDADEDLDSDMPESNGGLSDEETMKQEARGSDTPTQNLEIDGDTTESTGTRKRQSIEGDIDESDMEQNRHAA